MCVGKKEIAADTAELLEGDGHNNHQARRSSDGQRDHSAATPRERKPIRRLASAWARISAPSAIMSAVCR